MSSKSPSENPETSPTDDGLLGPRPRVQVGRLTFLSIAILVLWAAWAIGYHQLQLQEAPDIARLSVLARLVCWVFPSFAYLVSSYQYGWSQPLGLGFPYGSRQVVRIFVTGFAVATLLILGTSLQFHTSPARLLAELRDHARVELEAPVFEEIVFRGVITSEALTWATQSSKDWTELRRRFWTAMLGSALVFVLVHWPYYWMIKPPAQVLSDSLSLAVTALVLGFAFAQTRSIYLCIFLHWLNNALSALSGTFVSS